MSEITKIKYYDLKLEALEGRLNTIVGRADEIARISRVMGRQLHNNILIVGPSGIGKTTLMHAWAQECARVGGQKTLPIVQMEADSFNVLNASGAVPFQRFCEALDSLPACVLCIDGFGALVHNKPTVLQAMVQLLRPMTEANRLQLILTLNTKEFQWVEGEQSNFTNVFEVMHLKPQPVDEQYQMLEQAIGRFPGGSTLDIQKNIYATALELGERFPSLGQLPASAISVIDEAIALVKSKNITIISEEDLYQVVSDKIGVPLTTLKVSEKELLKNLESGLNAKVIGQGSAIKQITSTIQRAKLGLKNPHRPLGSFLVLGPSGVGKTETAKLVAETVFGKKESFVRIDMSEFGEAHTVSRLIGAPAGYVGFDAGGGLTNAVKLEPYSLVLLDEAEKAHPKIFDIFLQLLDDGRLTSGQGETIDFTQTIIMATSNLAVSEIIQGFQADEDIHSEEFLHRVLVPALTHVFRPEFINRFDAILVFNPLTQEDLLQIATIEIQKVEARVAKHRIKFKIDPMVLSNKIKTLADPRFGARPVKRFIETTCEGLISKKLLASF